MVKATRIIQPQTIKPGETVTVTVEITNDILKSVALHEILPTGWKIEKGMTNAMDFKESTNEWIWPHHARPRHGFSTLSPIMTASYSLIVPHDILPGKYQISGTVMYAEGDLMNVSGDFEITVINDKIPVIPEVKPTLSETVLPETAIIT